MISNSGSRKPHLSKEKNLENLVTKDCIFVAVSGCIYGWLWVKGRRGLLVSRVRLMCVNTLRIISVETPIKQKESESVRQAQREEVNISLLMRVRDKQITRIPQK